MSWLPRNLVLGELEIVETFVYYDGPRIFSCRSLTDQFYLGIWAEDREVDDLWIYVPVSSNRLTLVRSGGLSLRRAVEIPEGPIFLVTLPGNSNGLDTVDVIDPGDLPERWLPAVESRLDLATPTTVAADSSEDLQRKALQENRTRVRIKLRHTDRFRTEAPTRQIGEVLVLTQKMLDTFGLSLGSESNSPTGRIPIEIASQTASDLVGLSAASFVINLASSSFDDLFGDSLFAESSQAILRLLDSELTSEGISVELAEIGPRAAKSFRKFVKGLADSGADVEVDAAGTNLQYARQNLTAERLDFLMLVLTRLVPDDDIAEIRGRMELVAFDAERRTFGLLDKDGFKYEGRVDDRAYSQSTHATIHDKYDVLIFATRVLDESIGETNTTYMLSQLVGVDGEEPTPLDGN